MKDGAGFQDFSVDPMMLVIDTAVNHQPCYCGSPACENCFTPVTA
jgi:hypothetical protein